MKIRSGFVSNSSSSSFIIAIDGKENPPCPHCGRKDVDFIDLIGPISGNNNTCISLHPEDIPDLIQELMEEKDKLEKENELFKLEDPKRPVDIRYNEYTIGQHIEYNTEIIERNAKTVKVLLEALAQNLKVYQISLDYHDDQLRKIFKDMCDTNRIKILVKEDD